MNTIAIEDIERFLDQVEELQRSHDDLLAACKGLVLEAELAPGPPHSYNRLQAARAAIAEGEGGSNT